MKQVLSIDKPEQALRILEQEQERRDSYYWTTAKGEQVNVRDMSDTHLKNTIKYLKEYLTEREIVMDNIGVLEDYYD